MPPKYLNVYSFQVNKFQLDLHGHSLTFTRYREGKWFQIIICANGIIFYDLFVS